MASGIKVLNVRILDYIHKNIFESTTIRLKSKQKRGVSYAGSSNQWFAKREKAGVAGWQDSSCGQFVPAPLEFDAPGSC